MRAYSLDLRTKVMAAVDAGMTKTEAARVFGISLATIKRYAARRRAQHTLAPSPHPGRPPHIGPEQEAILRAQVTAHAAAYLDEHCELFAAQTGIRVSQETMSRTIRRFGITRKKGRWVPPNATSADAECGAGW